MSTQNRQEGQTTESSYVMSHKECDFSSDDEESSTLLDTTTGSKSSLKAEVAQTIKGDDFSHVSIFSDPVLSLKTLARVAKQTLKQCDAFFQAHRQPIIFTVLALTMFIVTPLPGSLNTSRNLTLDIVKFVIYWVGLGIASSIGLGTGLHTFILYLGPHIAQVILAANECNKVPEMLPSRWQFDHFGYCKSVPDDQVTIGFFAIYWAVFFEAFLWGAGTAIGELPPYFVARAASAAGGMDEELEDIFDDNDNKKEKNTAAATSTDADE